MSEPAGRDSTVTFGEIVRTLERIERRLDAVAGDHEQRLRKVERWMYAVPPTLVLSLGSIVALFVKAAG